MVPKGFRLERGLLWPEADRDCAAVVFDTAPDLEIALGLCKGRRVVVQAGGNCGVWPRYLATRFETVYTFEPDPANFTALAFNTAEFPNVIRTQAGLGHWPEQVELVREAANCGAHYVAEDRLGSLPIVRLDDFRLCDCDLVVLDVEGYEPRAIKGALLTIGRFKPVVVVEDKGLSVKYGSPIGTVEKMLAPYGYTVAARVHRDVVLACAR